MAVPTISGRIRLPDDSVHTGPFRLYRRSGPMLNGTTLVGLSAISLTTETDGDFSTPLHPGEYVLDTLVSRYPGAPPFAVVFRVPNESGTLNFADLEFVTRLTEPAWFGGTSGGDGTTPTATTSTAGKVKIKEDEGDPVVANWSIFSGSSTDPIVFRIVSGALRLYIRNATTGDFHQLLCDTIGGTVVTGPDQTGVAFGSLPGS